jgi:hypothetical protein
MSLLGCDKKAVDRAWSSDKRFYRVFGHDFPIAVIFY